MATLPSAFVHVADRFVDIFMEQTLFSTTPKREHVNMDDAATKDPTLDGPELGFTR